jgi:hypothetical protein
MLALTRAKIAGGDAQNCDFVKRAAIPAPNVAVSAGMRAVGREAAAEALMMTAPRGSVAGTHSPAHFFAAGWGLLGKEVGVTSSL